VDQRIELPAEKAILSSDLSAIEIDIEIEIFFSQSTFSSA
jgi:hypothetical protein